MLFVEKLIQLIATYAPLAPEHAPSPPADRKFNLNYFLAVRNFLRYIVHAKEAYDAISYFMWLCHGFCHNDEAMIISSKIAEMSVSGEMRKLLIIAKSEGLIFAVEKTESRLLMLSSRNENHVILSSGDDVLQKVNNLDLINKTNLLGTIYNHPTRGHWFPDFNINQYRYVIVD